MIVTLSHFELNHRGDPSGSLAYPSFSCSLLGHVTFTKCSVALASTVESGKHTHTAGFPK